MPRSGSAADGTERSFMTAGNSSRERMISDLVEPNGGDVFIVIWARIHKCYCGGSDTSGGTTGDGTTEDGGSTGDAVGSATGVLSRCLSSIGPDCWRLAW